MQGLPHFIRYLVVCFLALPLPWANLACLAHSPQPAPTVLTAAIMVAQENEQAVKLPHSIPDKVVSNSGGRVIYRIYLDLLQTPEAALGVFIPKISLSGELRVNGHPAGACAPASLERLRCLHQPHLFIPAIDSWKPGRNVLEIELYVTSSQTNGLAAISVGPATQLYENEYSLQRLLRIDMIAGISLLTACLGLISFAMAITERWNHVYAWFGLACIASAFSGLMTLTELPGIQLEVFDWLDFSFPLIAAPSLMLTALTYYGNRWPPIRFLLKLFVLTLPCAIWLSVDRRLWVAIAYIPLIAAGGALLLGMTYWALKSRRLQDVLLTASFHTVGATGLVDWWRFVSGEPFEKIYLLPYANAGTLLVMGSIIANQLTRALRTSRELTKTLEIKLAEREAVLQKDHQEKLTLQESLVRVEERENMLRDMHDGLGSSLSGAHLMLTSGVLSMGQAADVLLECIDDLRLLLDTSSNTGGYLEHAFADFGHRMTPRMKAARIEYQTSFALDDDLPRSSRELLQIMRITQEAVTNALRHANAKIIRLDARNSTSSGNLEVWVYDNGQGIPSSVLDNPAGRGIRNMRARAFSLGGFIEIKPLNPGTIVNLIVPRGPPNP